MEKNHHHHHPQQAAALQQPEYKPQHEDEEAALESESQTNPNNNNNKKMRISASGFLRDHKVGELVRHKRRLVEVPYTATLAQTVTTLVANNVVAVPVAAPPGHWIGAGGSMILESDKVTGAVRKHYIGIVTMLDVLAHVAEVEDVDGGGDAGLQQESSLDRRMSVPVSSIIGHSLEGLTLWTLNPNTSILDCMETFSKGVHRALIPLETQADSAVFVELNEASPGYRMLTQMDVLSFLRTHSQELKDIILNSVQESGAINETVFAVTENTKVIDTLKSMRAADLNAVPVVEGIGDDQVLKDGKGSKLVDTFSATDLRGCPIDLLQSWLSLSVTEFKERLAVRSTGDSTSPNGSSYDLEKLVKCRREMSLGDVIELAVVNHVHRVWVVDEQGLLRGLVSLTDLLRAVRVSGLLEEQDVLNVVPHHQSSN